MKQNSRQHHRSLDDAHRDPRRGMVLLIVMIVIVMISLAGLSFAALMYTERKAVHLHGDELQLASVVDSGAEFLKTFLSQPSADRLAAGGIEENPELFRGILVLNDEDFSRRARFSVVSPRIEEEETTGVRFGVEDESAKLNLAVLIDWEQRSPGSAKHALMHLPEMSESTAESILDWLDHDSQPRSQGAEADFYSGLEPSYSPRNAVPESLEELLLVKGIGRGLLFGADANRNYFVEEQEERLIAERSDFLRDKDFQPWSSLLTIYSANHNRDPVGRAKIDLNDPDLNRLHARLAEVFDEQSARFIIAYRQQGPTLAEAIGSAGAAVPFDLNRPPIIFMTSIYDLIGARIEIPASGSSSAPSIVAGPFREERESMRSYLPKLLDYTTLSPTSVIPGRINVNKAPRAVLMGVPGMDEALVEQILSARGVQTDAAQSERRHAGWLLVDGLVDIAKMKELAPYLTGGGDVFRAQIVGFFDDPAPVTRVELIIDTTTLPARQLYKKDLRLLGRGFASEKLGAEPTDGDPSLDSHNSSPARLTPAGL